MYSDRFKLMGVLFVALLSTAANPERVKADFIGFGSGWGLPGAIQFETPIGGIGGSPVEDTMFELDGQVAVSKFHPDWGTLNSVTLTVNGVSIYTYDYSPEIPETLPGGLAQAATFTADVSISQSEIGLSLSDTETGGSPGLLGNLTPGVEFSGSVSSSPFIGYGYIEFDLHHELAGNIFVDEGTGFPQEGWEGAMSGIFGGTLTVVYNYTPATSPTGGPPNGDGSCPSCGPLPGDADLDDFVGIGDMNIVLGNWNKNVEGWNNGDFDGNGFIGISDLNYVLSNWNAAIPPVVDMNTVIPEPNIGCLFAAGLLGFAVRSDRRKTHLSFSSGK